MIFAIIGVIMYYVGLYLYFKGKKGFEIGPLGIIILMISLIFVCNEYALMA